MSDKPRSWWIDPVSNMVRSEDWHEHSGHEVRVIERYAYERVLLSEKIWQEKWGIAGTDRLRLEKERDELKAILANHKLYEDYQNEIDTLKSRSAKLVKSLEEVRNYLEDLSSGREIGTDMRTAGEKTKRYAHQIIVEIDAALKKWGKT